MYLLIFIFLFSETHLDPRDDPAGVYQPAKVSSSMKPCGSRGKYYSWRNFQGPAINSARLSHQVQPALGSVTSYNAAEEATAMCPSHGDRLLGVTNTCQTCSRPKIEINNSCFALVPFTWGEPYMHRPACCSLPWPKHHLTDIPGLGKSTGHGTARHTPDGSE